MNAETKTTSNILSFFSHNKTFFFQLKGEIYPRSENTEQHVSDFLVSTPAQNFCVLHSWALTEF